MDVPHQSATSLAISQAVTAIRQHAPHLQPVVGLILGTGLGDLAELINSAIVIPYADIPGFPGSTALAHKGRLILGELGSIPVVALQGRSHLYEGHSFEKLMFPTHVMAALGIKQLIVSNAAGGVNPLFTSGDIMVIQDHINFMFQQQRLTSAAFRGEIVRPLYSQRLISQTQTLALQHNIQLQRGVYVGVTGPNYETRAEYRLFRKIGGDAVGMSTIPEVLAASMQNIEVLGFSAITNVAKPDAPDVVNAQEVVNGAAHVAPKLARIILALLETTEH
jgi:purine-nucleoside phosphorylase